MKPIILTSSLILSSFNALSQSGTLDASFGNGGKVLTNVDQTRNVVNSVLVQPDGKSVIIGYCTPGDYEGYFTLVRYNADGSLDGSFGVSGIVTTIINGNEDIAFSGVLQQDGKIVAAGYTWTGVDYNFAMVRYNPDGTRDLTFGNSGIVTTDFNGNQDKANKILLQENGDIVLAGYSGDAVFNNIDMALAKYHPDGSLDHTFGNEGLVVIPVSESEGWDVVRSAAAQADGKIVIAGFTEIYDPLQSSNQKLVCVLRLLSNGVVDQSFGNAGIFMLGIGEDALATAVAVAEDSKIIVLAETKAQKYNGTTDFALLRVTQAGVLDTNFGSDGITITAFDSSDDTGSSLILQPDQKILAAGYTAVNNGSTVDFALARYDKEGFLDNTFGSGGKVTIDFAGGLDFGGAIAMQKNGKIIMVGSARVGNDFDFGLVRLLNDATLPVRLIRLEANPVEDQIVVRWATSCETNSAHFEVLRSLDAKNWTSLGTVNGAHFTQVTTHYLFIDPAPSLGTNYYRLKMVDADLSYTFSSIVSADMGLGAKHNNFVLYPNPTFGRLNVRSIIDAEPVFAEVFDINGKRLLMSSLLKNGLDLSSLASGSYIVSIMDEKARIQNFRISLKK